MDKLYESSEVSYTIGTLSKDGGFLVRLANNNKTLLATFVPQIDCLDYVTMVITLVNTVANKPSKVTFPNQNLMRSLENAQDKLAIFNFVIQALPQINPEASDPELKSHIIDLKQKYEYVVTYAPVVLKDGTAWIERDSRFSFLASLNSINTSVPELIRLISEKLTSPARK